MRRLTIILGAALLGLILFNGSCWFGGDTDRQQSKTIIVTVLSDALPVGGAIVRWQHFTTGEGADAVTAADGRAWLQITYNPNTTDHLLTIQSGARQVVLRSPHYAEGGTESGADYYLVVDLATVIN